MTTSRSDVALRQYSWHMKTCFKCNIKKDLDCFYKHPQMADGYLNKCKGCSKKDVMSNRESKVDYYRGYDAKRQQDPERRKKKAVYLKRFRQKNSLMNAAHCKVQRAIKKGILIRGNCSMCNATEDIHAHHEDYSKPLEVIWLCVKCHIGGVHGK